MDSTSHRQRYFPFMRGHLQATQVHIWRAQPRPFDRSYADFSAISQALQYTALATHFIWCRAKACLTRWKSNVDAQPTKLGFRERQFTTIEVHKI